jgi:hypothetical protein
MVCITESEPERKKEEGRKKKNEDIAEKFRVGGKKKEEQSLILERERETHTKYTGAKKTRQNLA